MNNVVFTRVIAYRNVKDYKFLSKLEPEKKEEIIEKLTPVLSKMKLTNLAKADKNMLNMLKSMKLIDNKSTNAFVGKDIVVDMFNGEHIKVVSSAVGYDKSCFDKVKDILDLLAEKISMSYNDDYGYLMSDLTKIGNGLSLECDISLSSLLEMGRIEQLRQNVRKLGYSLESVDKDIFRLSTICNLGFNQKEVVDEFDKMVVKLQDLEIESAKMLDINKHDEIVDRVERSLAILNHAHLMNYDELSRLIANVRLGNNIGVCDVKNLSQLDYLIMSKDNEFASQSELKELATKVKNILKGE